MNKLLSIIVTDNLKWESNTQYICAKVHKRMWTSSRMKITNVDLYILHDDYTKEIWRYLKWLSNMAQWADLKTIGHNWVNSLTKWPLWYGQKNPINLPSVPLSQDKLIKTSIIQGWNPSFFMNKCNTERYFKSHINYLTRTLNREEESWYYQVL